MPTDITQERLARRIQELYDSDPQLVGSRRSRRLCAKWQRWSPAGSNRRRCSTQ
jgi:hypothetical protein